MEEGFLIFQSGAGRVPEGVSPSLVMGPEQVLMCRTVGVAYSPHLTNLLVEQLGESFGAFQGQCLQKVGV